MVKNQVTNWSITLDWSDGQVTVAADLPEDLKKDIQEFVNKIEEDANDAKESNEE